MLRPKHVLWGQSELDVWLVNPCCVTLNPSEPLGQIYQGIPKINGRIDGQLQNKIQTKSDAASFNVYRIP